MTRSTRPSARPRIVLGETDAERLSGLALRHEATQPGVARLLLDEIARAEVRRDSRVRDDIVGMNSTVQFRDEAHGHERTVRLVYPQDADFAAGRISILTPVGVALIGLAAGQSILWPNRDGGKRALHILSVVRSAAGA